MIHVMIRHKVAEYTRWKEAFDAHHTARKHAGETGCRLYQNVEDPREVIIFSDWDSLEQARTFMTSEEVRKTMQQAGVVGAPEIQFVEAARTLRRSAAD
jgi:heme-degrading monooxygenase HmoA